MGIKELHFITQEMVKLKSSNRRKEGTVAEPEIVPIK